MELSREICERARRSRDPRFDGRFFIAVKTTKIYCRPICPAPGPKEANVLYFPCAAAAAEAGFRPCLRCRPEASPGTPAWSGSSATVSRALRLIEESGLVDASVDDLAARLGVGSRHLRRLFVQHLGATPVAVEQTRRIHFAKKLIDETEMPFTQAALASGFGSIRRFNASFRDLYGRTPTQLRQLARRIGVSRGERYQFRLSYRPPFDWDALLGFLAPRAIPGVEEITGGCYRRTISLNGASGHIEIRPDSRGDALDLRIEFPEVRSLIVIVERVRRLFDLRAEPAEISARLRTDPLLARRVAQRPGLRVPGAWCGFELAVRAIVGQQVSVKGATTLAGRIVRAFGEPIEAGGTLTHVFPTSAALARADYSAIGLPAARAEAIRGLAQAVERGDIAFSAVGEPEQLMKRLRALPGIGEWTAQYIALRALSEPDAFPAADLGLLKASGESNARRLEARAEAWRPWRAYAAMHLWQTPGQNAGQNEESNGNHLLHLHGKPDRAPAVSR